jgi:hypothetical protein
MSRALGRSRTCFLRIRIPPCRPLHYESILLKVRRDGFEPPYPKDQIYSLAQLTTLPPTLGVTGGTSTLLDQGHNLAPR